MSFERYVRICENTGARIKPKGEYTLHFNGDSVKSANRLFFTSETGISYLWKSEPDYQELYRRIDDSLNMEEAECDRYCLDFSDTFRPYTKIAYKKIVAPLILSYAYLFGYDNKWKLGIRAKAENLVVRGFLKVTLEVRLKKDGIDAHDTRQDPDRVFEIQIPEGTYGWTNFEKAIEFDTDSVASIGYFVEGENYSGKLYFESPLLMSADSHNIIPPFVPHTADRHHFNWMGQNLSKIEWTNLKIKLNGNEIFNGEIFERCHRMSEKEIRIPKNVIKNGDNTLTFENTTDYREAPFYSLAEVGFIINRDSKIVAVPENVTANKPFAVFVEGKNGEEFSLVSDKVTSVSDLVLKRDGLGALLLVCKSPDTNIEFVLGGEKCKIARCVEKGEDGIITGTGDAVYINIERQDVEDYLKWYLSSNIADFVTLRPTYRWCGTRVLNESLWKEVADILSEGRIPYVHMIDGRELPGGDCNPKFETLDSEYFLGRQNHEFDGAFAYWGVRDFSNNPDIEMFYDLFLKMNKKSPETTPNQYVPENLHYGKNSRTMFIDPETEQDMQKASEKFVENLKGCRNGATRHTGPSTLFKYFYQAGYEWTGAELMYSPTEICSAALRGAADLYGGKMGAHHAVQWSTTPHDTETRYRRYALALFISYIQGIHDINTEEGLWRLEQYYYPFNRFSEPCIRHTEEQQKFFRYVTTHTRTGRFKTPIAFISGRYDGWECFATYSNTWGLPGFGFKSPEKAWDILTYFYPKSVLDNFYIMGCPDEPQGFYSGTPFGNVDIVPIEAPDFSRYRLIAAVGYNKALHEDMDKFVSHMENGGTLILGWPQLSTTTNREKVVACEHEYISHPITPAENPVFVSDTFSGESVTVCENIPDGKVLVYTDSKKPLVIEYTKGDGKMIFVNAREWAGDSAVDKAWRTCLDVAVPECLEKEDVCARGNENIQFTVFENEDSSRNVYFIATDWHRDCGDGEGILIIKNKEYKIPVPFGTLIKTAVFENTALYPESDTAEVISLRENSARVQGVGTQIFNLLKNGERKKITVDFTDCPVKEILF